MTDGPVLLLTAHADDCEFFAGGLVAKFAAEGREIYEVIATNNERGTFELDRDEIISVSRDREARDAAKVLEKRDVFFLEYPDGFLGDTPINVLREQFMRYIRQIRPSTLLTFDPFAPYEPHPDHRAVAFAAMEAAGFASLPFYHHEHLREGLETHYVAETYYFAKRPRDVNKLVDITPHIDKKIESILCHESQVRMMVEDVKRTFAATGGDPNALAMLDADNPGPVIETFVRAWAAGVGERAGVEYAEEYRYERAGDLIRELTGDAAPE
ncbi:PIG-L family deacetylase [bacterium]|nr:PIG-L family deacetylase [bacterium]